MRKFHLLIFILLLVVVGATPVAGVADFTLRSRQIYEVRQQVRLTKTGGLIQNLRLEIPVFLNDNLPPYQRIIAFDTNLSALKMKPSETEPVAIYYLPSWQKPQELVIEFYYTIENMTINYRLPRYAGGNTVDRCYLAAEPQIESDAESITDLVAAVSGQEPYPIDKAMKLFEYVNSKIQYQVNNSPTHSALQTLQRGTGDCEDFSLLYIALCRAAGLPARFVNGFRFDPARLKKGDATDLNQFAHAWTEVNLPGIGWLPVEPTYTYLVNGVKQVSHEFFGKLRDDDRHLLFNYSHGGGASCSWSHNRRIQPQLKMNTRMTIRRKK